jgi:SPP1 gp7 family putative phage head morphogenesis protein
MNSLAHKHEHTAPSLKVHARRSDNYDPTRTTGIRAAFVRDAQKRFRKVKKNIRVSILDNDALALEERKPLKIQEPLPEKAFQFKTDPQKAEAFMEWLRTELDAEILEGEGRKVVGNAQWANVHVDSAYRQGLRRAHQETGKIGALPPNMATMTPEQYVNYAFLGPVHADKIGLIYTRVFSELRGITDALDQKISRTLAEGLASGWGPRRMVREMGDVVEKIGVTRARILARTETIRAHHVATINTYREAKLEGVKIKAEWATAGDDRVCLDCLDLDGHVFTLEVMDGLIPLHPQCRCCALPFQPGDKAQSRTADDILEQVGSQYKDKKGRVVRRGYYEKITGKKSPGHFPVGKKIKAKG